MDILRAEGLIYFEQEVEEIGGFVKGWDIFAIHSNDCWKDVVEKIKSLHTFIFIYDSVRLLKSTKMKNGKTNYVFECE